MIHLCVPQNQALGVCRGCVPDVRVCGTHGKEELVNATITLNAVEEEEDTVKRKQLERNARTAGVQGWVGREVEGGGGGVQELRLFSNLH